MCTFVHSSSPEGRKLCTVNATDEMGNHGYFYLLYKLDCPPKGHAVSHWSSVARNTGCPVFKSKTYKNLMFIMSSSNLNKQ